jgi:preprotein translocase subunit SecD
VTVRRGLLFLAGVVGGLVSFGATTAGARTPDVVEFRPVISTLPAAGTTSTSSPADVATARDAVARCDDAAVAQMGSVPTTPTTDIQGEQCVVLVGKGGDRYYLGPAAVATDAVKTANAQFVPGQGWTVKLMLTKAGSKAWDRLAEQQFHKQAGIVVSGKVVAAPTIEPNGPKFSTFGGTAVISGVFTRKEALAAAQRIRAANDR